MENEETKVTEQPVVEEKTETPAKKQAKRGQKPKTAKKTATRAKKETTAKRGAKKTVKAPVAKAPEKAASKYTFARTVFEYQKLQYTEEMANKKVLEYLEKHPYIKASKIETFINFDEHKLFFTVDGYSNSDFVLEL